MDNKDDYNFDEMEISPENFLIIYNNRGKINK
ncbi:hypothetical protein NVP1101O_094 [Vibrio phage 1.101.O._10N.261.45.C6]|nr:hypothetical protein NVP1101O_094 [Vibrio phage 1.101.O._10N.261.45.C6]